MDQLLEAVGFGFVTSAIVALGAVGFTLQYSVSHMFNFAYGAVMTLAAYFAYFVNTTLGWNIWLSVAAGAAFGAVVTAGIHSGVYKPFARRGAGAFSLLIATIGVGLVITSAVNAIWGFGPKNYNVRFEIAIRAWKFLWTPRELVIMGLAVVSMALLHAVLRYSRLGKAIRAVADDADLASSSGVDARVVTLTAWAISGAMCGLAGVVLALDTASFASDVGTNLLLVVVAAAVVGGVGEPYGAMIGALTVGVTSEVSAIVISPGLKNVVAFVLLVAVLIVRPYGIRSGERMRPEARPG